ncbi:hypothetical protein EV681_4498 [Advenella incenata]|uniref:Uncharacterized protein n=1 Tax=Advenella incenata TaxID=267800 RepID=A0A4Q7VAM0_9BURK|nr:hypothetical protein [Advenella incenata]RZT91738.1 hypothetical protein EV681_4498 [Advenella incenata]
MKKIDTNHILKQVARFWCHELMIKTNCKNSSQLEKVLDDIFDSPSERSSNIYYKYWMALRSPRPDIIARCEKKIRDSAWLMNNLLWTVINLESLDNNLARLFLSQLDTRYLNNVGKDWYRSTNLYRDSFTDKILRLTTLDSLAVLVILVKLAHQNGDQINEVRIAKQLYRGLLIIGAQFTEKNFILESFFSLFDEFLFKRINWGDRKPIMDFPFYRFGVRYLNSLYPIKENLGLTLVDKTDKQYILDRCHCLLPGLLNLRNLANIESLNFMLMPKDIEYRKLSDYDNLDDHIGVWVTDLTAMNYPFEDNSMSYYRNRYLHAKFLDLYFS